ncbi:MAG: DUF3108 domain-containing protein [Pseudomonadales bacterium]|nr:DUF3108 domain-containing protein [Pseudomonadales bacterium]
MQTFYRATMLLLFFVLNSISSAQTPTQYSIEYQASANGIAATANRSLQVQADQTFRLSNTLEASLGGLLVARIEQVSTLDSIDEEVKPINYSYQQSGLSPETQAINYNWDALVAISAEDDESWTVDLMPNTYDQLSHQLALREAIIADTDKLEFAVIDEDEIEIHRYQVVGKEIVTTPLGNFESTKVERIRDSSDSRNTFFWLADDWQFVLIRMEQSNSGLTVVLELQSGTVEGAVIEPLN